MNKSKSKGWNFIKKMRNQKLLKSKLNLVKISVMEICKILLNKDHRGLKSRKELIFYWKIKEII